MKAIYNPRRDCRGCVETFGNLPNHKACDACKKILREEVEVLQYGVGLFGTKSVVADGNGNVKTVDTADLTPWIRGEGKGERV